MSVCIVVSTHVYVHHASHFLEVHAELQWSVPICPLRSAYRAHEDS